MIPISTETLDGTLTALAAFLKDSKAAPEHLVLIGGAALLALGFVSRTTRDVDIMAGVDARDGLVDPRPMSASLREAASKVARELDLDPDWLNTGPADQLRAGLPEGFLSRLTRRDYGPHLVVYYPSRFDLIHLKLFAAVDQGAGRHTRDLAALQPTEEDLLAAARWVLTQDAGEVFPELLKSTLRESGYGSVADRI
jgi:hypothetical protein